MPFFRFSHAPLVFLLPLFFSGCATSPSVIVGKDLATLPFHQPETAQRASSSASPDWQWNNADCRHIPAGGSLVLAELEGPGIIRHIWTTIAASELGYQKKVVIRMYWDDEAHPSVEVPLGDFFGIGHAMDQPYESMPITVSSEGRARNCYWPMPFRKSARITVTNEGSIPVACFFWYIDWASGVELPRNTCYFHAMYRQEYPCASGKNYLIADIEGRGQYVGTSLNVLHRAPRWWGEGDDFFFIDGEETPRLKGTGSEDYFCDAWGLRQFSSPHYGAPVMEGNDAWDRTTVYRWHIADPISFHRSLRAEIEHYGVTWTEDGNVASHFGERSDSFSSVAFWYQQEPHKAFPPLPPANQRLYFDFVTKIEAESLLLPASGDTSIQIQENPIWSGGKQLFWTAEAPNGFLELTFTVPEEGRYMVVPMLTHSHDYGVFDLYLDGEPLAALEDLRAQNAVVHPAITQVRHLQAGKHVLGIRNRGKNTASTGYFFGMDCLYLAVENLSPDSDS